MGWTPPPVVFERNIPERVMIPAYARPAHKRLRDKLARIQAWNESSPLNRIVAGEDHRLGIITSGVSYAHVREAAPEARVLKLGLTYPLPIQAIRTFIETVERCVVVEEGDPYLVESIRYHGLAVEGKPEMYRFGELNVARVRRILANDMTPEPPPVPGKPPQLCAGCPHRVAFSCLGRMGCIVSGDIGCYTLGVLPPFEAMDTCVCMGASIPVGLGMRHALPPDQAKMVVSVIGDSTFVHSGLTGLVEAVYNKPPTGHLIIILDNGTTAMTGMQEHPGTGRMLDHAPTSKLDFEAIARGIGIENVFTVDPTVDPSGFEDLVRAHLDTGEVTVIIARKPCKLAEMKIAGYEAAAAQHKCEAHVS